MLLEATNRSALLRFLNAWQQYLHWLRGLPESTGRWCAGWWMWTRSAFETSDFKPFQPLALDKQAQCAMKFKDPRDAWQIHQDLREWAFRHGYCMV